MGAAKHKAAQDAIAEHQKAVRHAAEMRVDGPAETAVQAVERQRQEQAALADLKRGDLLASKHLHFHYRFTFTKGYVIDARGFLFYA